MAHYIINYRKVKGIGKGKVVASEVQADTPADAVKLAPEGAVVISYTELTDGHVANGGV